MEHRPLEKLPAGERMEPAAQAAHLGGKQGLVEKEKIRPMHTQAEQLGEALNGALKGLRQRLCRLVSKAKMGINRGQTNHLQEKFMAKTPHGIYFTSFFPI